MAHSPTDSALIASALERELAFVTQLESLSAGGDDDVAAAIDGRRRAAKDAIAALVRLAYDPNAAAQSANVDAAPANAGSAATARLSADAGVVPSVAPRESVGALTVGSLRHVPLEDSGRGRR